MSEVIACKIDVTKIDKARLFQGLKVLDGFPRPRRKGKDGTIRHSNMPRMRGRTADYSRTQRGCMGWARDMF